MIDNWTILNVGDHPYINKESFIKYQSALTHDKQWLSNNMLDSYEQISTQILKNIQSAFDVKSGNPKILKKYISLYNEWNIDNIMANF